MAPSAPLSPRAGASGNENRIASVRNPNSKIENPKSWKLNAEVIGSEASKVWAKARLRDRIEAVIVHEYLEAQGIAHDEVVERAAETDLPIGENARRILRRIAEGVRRRGVR